MAEADPQVARRPLVRVEHGALHREDDSVAIERALEIRVDDRPVAVTLRTPGHDRELALGFLAGEGLVRSPKDVAGVREHPASCSDQPDAVEIELAPAITFDWTRLERHFAATAACGLCGRAHLEALRAGLTPLEARERWSAEAILALPARLGAAQAAFKVTGGLHAAAYCDAALEVSALREDVGRHNAVDKVVGWMLGEGRLPADGGLLWVSGRAGAELVLKAARARIAGLAAVGAPSSLAIELAEAAGMTLIGFVRDRRMNVYCGIERVRVPPA